MKALTFQGKRTIGHETVADPVVETAGDAVVRVELAGICGSDLHPYHEREKGLDHGTVMGHEFVGEVVETGAEVRGLSAGDRVFSPFTTCCGDCFYCRCGLTCRCTDGQLFGWVSGGVGLQGGQAEYVRVPLADTTLLRVPEGIEPEAALLLGDILSTGYFCAEQAGVEPGGAYAVVGCGPVGLMAVIGARELGAERLYAIDTIPERLALAQRLGAETIDYVREDAVARLHEATDGRGVDAVLEAVGSGAAMRLAVDVVRLGGTISSVGVQTEAAFAFTPVEAYDKNLTVRSGRCPARHYMERLVPMARAKQRDATSVITHRLSLGDGPRGYEIFDGKLDGCIKVILEPDPAGARERSVQSS